MLVLSECPLSDLIYLSSDSGGFLTEAAQCRTDSILGVGTSERTLQTLFNDYVSIYSPLSAEAGDEYLLPTRKVFNEFLI